MYRLIMWDLDGTLADTSEGVINAVRFVEHKFNLPALSSNEYSKFIGPPNVESYTKYHGLSGEMLCQAIVAHKEYAVNKGACEAKVYPGIEGLLQELKEKNYLQAVVTLKQQESAERVLKHLKIAGYFDIIIGASALTDTKKKILENCISMMKCTKDECVLIGDSIYDQEAAHEVGVDFIAVLYGFGFRKEEDTKKYPVKQVVFNIEELRQFLVI